MQYKNQKIRLQKFLSIAGVTSRRKSEEMVRKKLVKINDIVANIGDKVDPNQDTVTIQNKIIKIESKIKYYIMLYKPRGYITTMYDEKNRKCVAGLIRAIPAKLHPVGRLDKNSEGLLLMTNDGNFTNSITHPSKEIYKKYRVTIKSKISEKQIKKLRMGIILDGRKTLPAIVSVVVAEDNRYVLEISIKEGRNRQIRRMCDTLNLEISRLKRISIGNLKLGTLKPGHWRNLTSEEVKNLCPKLENVTY